MDYHAPAQGILEYPESRRINVSSLADISKETRDPTQKPEEHFLYIEVANIDVQTGTIVNPKELVGEEAPSRARMIVKAFDIIVSTVRPTRGAIAVVPPELHNQICSTGFCVIRCKENVNPYYLHFVLRSQSTLEQFRKFSTGSSYPAILDDDVSKTIIPNASPDEQDKIVKAVMVAYRQRLKLISQATLDFEKAVSSSSEYLKQNGTEATEHLHFDNGIEGVTIDEIKKLKEEIAKNDLSLLQAVES